MEESKGRLIKVLLDCGALQFGEFTLKSGRVSPYFFNMGKVNTGKSLMTLVDNYTSLVYKICYHQDVPVDVLFGPAYKGIPLVTNVACFLHRMIAKDIPWAFNRKEAKDHGEGGSIVGYPIDGRNVLILDDVITAGTAIRECLTLFEEVAAEPRGVVVTLDRQEKGKDTDKSAIQQLEDEYGIKVWSLLTFTDIIEYYSGLQREDDQYLVEAMLKYREDYGVKS